jgi:NH3-dependent NAD+ synthetase
MRQVPRPELAIGVQGVQDGTLVGVLRAEEIETHRPPDIEALEDRSEQFLLGHEMHAQVVREDADGTQELGCLARQILIAACEHVRGRLARLIR